MRSMTSMMSTIMKKKRRKRMMTRMRMMDRYSLERRSPPSPSSPVPSLSSRSQATSLPLLLPDPEIQQEDAVVCRHHPRKQAWNVVNLSFLTSSSPRSNKSNFSSTNSRANAPSHHRHARHPTVSLPQTLTEKGVPPLRLLPATVTVDRASLPRH